MTSNLTTELVCTRLSHDIIGNIGAVANAVELLEEGDMDFLEDIKSILKASSQTLAARLKFFRMAFGLNNANLDDAGLVLQTAKEYLATLGNKDFPIMLHFNVCGAAKRKTALQMIMVLSDILIRGGEITVTEDNGRLTALVPAGTKTAAEKLNKLQAALSGGPAEHDAVMAPLYALRDSGCTISLCTDDGQIKLTAE